MLTTSKDTETWKSFFKFSNFQDEKKCPQVVCQKTNKQTPPQKNSYPTVKEPSIYNQSETDS